MKNKIISVLLIVTILMFMFGSCDASTEYQSNDNSQTFDSEIFTNDSNDITTNSDTTQPENITTEPNNTESDDNTSIEPDNTTTDDEKKEMVWIPSTGTKYHSKSTCSGMNSPTQVPIEDAIKQGYTACKKCY